MKMKCNSCEYNFALFDESYNGTQVCCKYDIGRCDIQIQKDKKKDHKCYRCSWSTWTGLSYKCALPRCMPNLGNFNGVGKSG